MVWVALHGDHPLLKISQGHIGGVSHRRWGIADLTWMVSEFGYMKMGGSSTWKNICPGWETLQKNNGCPLDREE